jgi:uncharacterized small protein (DUF1192 family)
METRKTPPVNKGLWEDIRETVREGTRELRDLGDELARQGRLRMDIFQTERRLKSAYGSLGELSYKMLSENRAVVPEETAVTELAARIKYYADELARLKEDLQRTPETGE